jgi:hypothetical protein
MERSHFDIKTRELFAAHMDGDLSDGNWTPVKAGIRNIFEAFYTCAYPANRVRDIVNAVSHTHYSEEAIKDALTSLVRAKVLRSRVQRGVRFYEVNY